MEIQVDPVTVATAEGRIHLAGKLVEALAAFGLERTEVLMGAADTGEPQLEIMCGRRWTIVRALPGGRWWANGRRVISWEAHNFVSGVGRHSVDVILREGDLSVLWQALLWAVGLRKEST